MTAIIIDGTKIGKEITDTLAMSVKKSGKVPGIAVIRVGDNPASRVYVNRKVQKAMEMGFHSEKHELPATATQEELLKVVAACNADPKIHGLLVQLPLPSHINPLVVQQAVLPEKDVDGFHPMNLGKLFVGHPHIVSATPRGIMTLIHTVHADLTGLNAVVVGRSAIVGRPIAQLLLAANATVTICHSKTRDLAAMTRTADILVVAIGEPQYITATHVKPGATVIDVGINRLPDGKLCGDVDFEQVKEVAGHITPVPGGVGPLTIASLMQNTYEAMERTR